MFMTLYFIFYKFINDYGRHSNIYIFEIFCNIVWFGKFIIKTITRIYGTT